MVDRLPIHLLQTPEAIVRAANDEACHFIVTGAGGWFGSASLEMLATVVALDHIHAFGRTERKHMLRDGRAIAIKPLSALAELSRPAGRLYVLHYAFLTREKAVAAELSAYVASNREITSHIEDQCRRLRPDGTFSTSSGAVYERDTGRLADDLQSNPYGVLKLEEEAAFLQHGQTFDCPAAVCRVFNVGGPFLNKEYALGSLIRAALNDPHIKVQAAHKVYRSYVHVADIISIGLGIAMGLIPLPVAAYDTAGLEAVEVGVLAERVKTILGCPEKPIERPPASGRPDDRYVGQTEPFFGLAKSFGLKLKLLDEQILDTAAFLAPSA